MTKHSLYDDTLEIDFDEKEHLYTATINGEPKGPIDGVTGLLSRVFGLSHAIAGWRQKLQAEYTLEKYLEFQEAGAFPEDFKQLKHGPSSPFIKEITKAKSAWRTIANQATGVGKRVHLFAENWEGDPVPEDDDPQYVQGCAAVVEFFEGSDFKTISTERVVASIDNWYCGTCDRLIEMDGRYAVMDFKTSKPFVNAWNGPYTEMALQLAAYAIALEEELKIEIHDGYIVRLDKTTGRPELHRVQLTLQLKNAWRNVRAIEKATGDLERIWTAQSQL